MADKLAIWNKALFHLGEGRLTDTDPDVDEVEAGYVFDAIWDTVIYDALSRGDWNFATKTTEVDQSTTTELVGGYAYVYDHPDDWIRTIAYNWREDFSDYVMDNYYTDVEVYEEGGSWFTDYNTFFVRHISSDYAADSAITGYPPSFVEYVAYLLAYQSCERITQGIQKAETLEKKADKALLKAKSNDARNLKRQAVRPGPWVRALGGYGTRTNGDGTLVGGSITVPEGET